MTENTPKFPHHPKCDNMCEMRAAAIRNTGDDWMECGDECAYQTIMDRLYPTAEKPPLWAAAANEFNALPWWRKRLRVIKWGIKDWWVDVQDWWWRWRR